MNSVLQYVRKKDCGVLSCH